MLKSRVDALTQLLNAPRSVEYQKAESDGTPSPPQPQGNRRARRRQETLLRRLTKKLGKDGTPVIVSRAPDGGIHVHVAKKAEAPVEPTAEETAAPEL